MPNPNKGLGKSELEEKIINIGVSMRMAGFKPLSSKEILQFLSSSDGGLTPITNAKDKETISGIPGLQGSPPQGALPFNQMTGGV